MEAPSQIHPNLKKIKKARAWSQLKSQKNYNKDRTRQTNAKEAEKSCDFSDQILVA